MKSGSLKGSLTEASLSVTHFLYIFSALDISKRLTFTFRAKAADISRTVVK